jgi:hypothetical protein
MLTAPKTTRALSPIYTSGQTTRRVLGFLGKRSNVRYEEIVSQIVEPVIQAWGIPDEILLPIEGESSYAIQRWAQTQGIAIQCIDCDWMAHGRRASMLRDAHIQREATHLVMIQGPRSNAYSALAERLRRKGRDVALSERPGLVVKTSGQNKISPIVRNGKEIIQGKEQTQS